MARVPSIHSLEEPEEKHHMAAERFLSVVLPAPSLQPTVDDAFVPGRVLWMS